MEKSLGIATLYGYSVCLVTVIGFLISLPQIVGTLVDLSDPVHTWRTSGFPSMASFETYKADVVRWNRAREGASPEDVADEQTLRAMYEAVKAERVRSVELLARRSLMAQGLLAIVCTVLFIMHWIWVRRLAPRDA